MTDVTAAIGDLRTVAKYMDALNLTNEHDACEEAADLLEAEHARAEQAEAALYPWGRDEISIVDSLKHRLDDAVAALKAIREQAIAHANLLNAGYSEGWVGPLWYTNRCDHSIAAIQHEDGCPLKEDANA